MKTIIFRAALIATLATVLSSCNLLNAIGNMFQRKLDASVTWSGTSEAKNIIPSTAHPPVGARSVETVNAMSSLYRELGTLVGTFTPTVFKLPLQNVEISNSTFFMNPVPFHIFNTSLDAWICQYADFTTPLAGIPDGEIQAGLYTDFLLFFFSSASRMLMQSNGKYLDSAPEIEVDLGQDYATAFTDLENGAALANPDFRANKFDVKNLGNGAYRFSLQKLQVRSIDMVLFTKDATLDVVSPGLVGSYVGPLRGYLKTPGPDSSAVNGLVRVPWQGLEIYDDAAIVEFVLNWDMANIIEVYDNSTPSDRRDDKVVLADKWWERIHLDTIQKTDKGTIALP